MKNINSKIIEGLYSLDKSLQVEIMNQLQSYDIHSKLGKSLQQEVNRKLFWQLRNQLNIGLLHFRCKKRYV
jgi:hypothetical protein